MNRHAFSSAEIESANLYLYRARGKGGEIWEGRAAYYETLEDGTRKRKTITHAFKANEARSRAQANRALSAWHRELIEQAQERERLAERQAYEAEHPTWTVPDYAEMVIRDYSQAAESSKLGYRPYLKRIRHTFKDMTLQELTADDVNKWHKQMRQEGLANTSIVHAHALLSQVMKQAVEDGLVTENVCKRRAAKPPRRDKREHNILTSSERGRLMDYLEAAPVSPLSIAVRIALESGMRIGEVCGLTWANTDLETGLIRVRHSVGKKEGGRYLKEPKSGAGVRDIPISEALRAVLRAYKSTAWENRLAFVKTTSEEFSELFVIGTIDGKYYSPDVLSREWRSLCKFLQLKGTQGAPTFHDLRHTAITVWIRENGIDPYTASKMAGHSSPAYTLSLYGNTDEAAMRRAADLAAETLERERLEANERREREESVLGHVFDLATGTEV